MKKILKCFIVGLVLVFGYTNVYAGTITLAWNPNTEDDLAGYKIYYGKVSGEYTQIIDVGNVNQKTIENIENDVVYYYAATAYDTNGNESGFSNEVSHKITINWDSEDTEAPAPPNLKVTKTTTEINATVTVETTGECN